MGERGELGELGRVRGEVVGVECRSASFYIDEGWRIERVGSRSFCK